MVSNCYYVQNSMRCVITNIRTRTMVKENILSIPSNVIVSYSYLDGHGSISLQICERNMPKCMWELKTLVRCASYLLVANGIYARFQTRGY